MNLQPFIPLVSDDEIERAAELAAKHARERAQLAGQQENERRKLQQQQQHELQALNAAPAPAAVPVAVEAAPAS